MRDLTAVKAALTEQEIELPSWAFGNTGTRFKVFGQPGVPRTPWEKAEDAAQVHRFTGVAPSMAVHIPVGQGGRLPGAGPARRRPRDQDRHRQRQRLPGRRLQARQRLQPRPEDPRQGRGPPAGVRRRHGRHRVARPQAVVRRRHQLPGPGRHQGPAGPPGRGAGRGLRQAGPAPADAAGVQAVRAVLLHHRRARTGAPACCTARRWARRPRWWSTPATTPRARTSSSSWPCCCAPVAWAGSTSTAASTPTTTSW